MITNIFFHFFSPRCSSVAPSASGRLLSAKQKKKKEKKKKKLYTDIERNNTIFVSLSQSRTLNGVPMAIS